MEESQRRLVWILRSTIEQLERNTDLRPDDPVFIELKQILLRRIAELELLLIAELEPVAKPFNVPGTTVVSMDGMRQKQSVIRTSKFGPTHKQRFANRGNIQNTSPNAQIAAARSELPPQLFNSLVGVAEPIGRSRGQLDDDQVF